MTEAAARSQPASLLPPEALARLDSVALVARWVVEGFLQGLHASPFHGFSAEFAEYRSYAPGEDLRHFDWKALAKSDRAYVKRYHSETNLKAHILLDASASMGFSAGGRPTKLRYGACLAAALARLLIRQQDAVGLGVYADRLASWLPPRCSARQERDIVRVLEGARPSAATRTADALHFVAEAAKARGLVVLVSDLYDDPAAVLTGLKHFRHKKHEVVVLHLFDPAERGLDFEGLADFRDLETGERLEVLPSAVRAAYRAAVEESIARFTLECAAARIDHVVVDTSEPFERALAAYLRKRSRLA